MIYKGLMLTNAMLPSEKDSALFEWGLDAMVDYDIQLIEFYTPELELSRLYGKLIRERGYKTIFHSALDQKRSGWCRLCAEDTAVREKSVDFTKVSIEKGIAAGALKVVVQSGLYPNDPSFEGVCLEALEKSMCELKRFAGNDVMLSIEPCDRSLDVRQLIGPALETYSFMKRPGLDGVSLTMDTAHIALTFEDPFEAIKLCKPFSNHVHIANCYIDRSHPLFGDKHPLFGVTGGSISDEEAQEMYGKILKLYSGEELYISTEMIGRDENLHRYFELMLSSMPWFFAKR